MARQSVRRLIDKERKLLLRGQGAVSTAREQLLNEEAEQHYQSIRSGRSHAKYLPSTEERIGKWASHTAEMLYNRKKKRGKV